MDKAQMEESVVSDTTVSLASLPRRMRKELTEATQNEEEEGWAKRILLLPLPLLLLLLILLHHLRHGNQMSDGNDDDDHHEYELPLSSDTEYSLYFYSGILWLCFCQWDDDR